MNLKQLEAEAKALAPVIRGCVEKAVAALRDEVRDWLASLVSEAEQRLEGRIEAIKQAIPAPDSGESVTEDTVKSLLSGHFANITEKTEEHYSASMKLYEQVSAAHEAHQIEVAAQIEAIKQAMPAPVTGEQFTADEVKRLISEALEAFKASFTPPKDGENGNPGLDGKDATQLEILPAVEFDKSYPRGTHVLHNGGLLRAYQQTVGEKGWEVLLNGVAGVEVEQKDARNFVIRTLQTNGKAMETAFTVPVMVYRGVYLDGETYQRGDTATWAGCLWHADADSPPGKPGTADSGWTMAAKKGRDAKNSGNAQ